MTRVIFFIMFLQISCAQRNTKIIIGEKLDGMYNGIYKEFNEDSLLVKEGIMENNKRVGTWKYYKNERLIHVKRYVEDTLYSVLDKNDYLFKKFYLKEIKSIIKIPKNWNIRNEHKNDKILISAFKNTDSLKIYKPTLIISYSELNGLDFKEYLNIENRAFANSKSFKIISFKKNNLKKDSYIMKYKTTQKDVNIGGLVYWIKIKNKVLILGCNSLIEDMEKYKLLFLEIANSIRQKNE